MGVSVQKLKEQNREYIPDFTRLDGRFIVICNMQDLSHVDHNLGPEVAASAAAEILKREYISANSQNSTNGKPD
jgi:hypothetical protein